MRWESPEGYVEAECWDARGHKRPGVTGVARWGGTPDLDPAGALALLLPKPLA